MASNYSLTDSSVENLYKRKYDPRSINTYNGKVALLGLLKKTYNLAGLQLELEAATGYAGGAGSGSLPTANRGVYVKPVVTSKSIYCVAEVDRRSTKLATSEGAFVRLIEEVTRKTVEKFNWNVDRMLLNTLSNGELGPIDSVSDSGGGVYVLTMSSTYWKSANFELRDMVNIETANTDLFEITAITASSYEVTVTRLSGSQVPAGGDEVFLQGSEATDIQSMAAAIAASSSTLYSVTVGAGWQSYQKSASSADISAPLINEATLGVEKQCGKTPTLAVTSYTQLRKLLDSCEDQKFYSLQPIKLNPRSADLQGVVSFAGVQIMTSQGPIPVIVDRFCDDDKFYFLNTDDIELMHAEGGGWFRDDGTVWLRKSGSDSYEARFGFYMENFTQPHSQGYIYSLGTS